MDASGRRWPRADLRVGDADRQAVVAELQRHYIDGRLSSEELGERVSRALAARTFGDLAEPVNDLPALYDRDATEIDRRPYGHASMAMASAADRIGARARRHRRAAGAFPYRGRRF